MELIEALNESQTPAEAMQAFDSFARDFGADSTCYGYLDADGKKHAWSSTAADWRKQYSANRLDKADPEFRVETRPFSGMGFRMSDGFPGLERDEEANRLYAEARLYGFTGELFVPDQSPEGLRDFATINVLTSLPNRSLKKWIKNEGAKLRLAGVSVAARIRELRVSDTTPQLELSPREVEVLRLLSRGLRVARIAESMELSNKTVEFHISNARRRLNAKTRDQAMAIALSRGLLHMRTI